MWTLFWDMSSGGSTKHRYEKIYIEADKEEAKKIFFNRFGTNPERVSCTCCGNDYSIDSDESFEQLSGFHRNCRAIEIPQGVDGLYDHKAIEGLKYYYEDNEDPPEGHKFAKRYTIGRSYQTVEEYKKNKDVLVITADEIKPKERIGKVPTQGYVWQE